MIYQIKVEYLGKKFVGWQAQKNGASIQETIERILSKILKENIRITGSGRTDAGVNATEQSAHFQTQKAILDKDVFLSSVNYFLSKFSISILNIKKRSSKFHARYSARERIYNYVIINRFSPLVLDKDRAWHIKKKLNISIMQKGAKILKGRHNFSTFRSSSCQASSPVRTLKKIMVKKNKNKIILTFQSQSFLQQQVRSMVGALKYLGEGKWNLKYFKKVFVSKKRILCAPPAPAQGLYLSKVIY